MRRPHYDYQCGGCGTLTGIRHRTADDLNPIDEMIFTRDAAGLIETMTDRFGLHRYQHDGLGRLTNADHPNAAGTSRGTSPVPDESYTHDPVGNRLSSHRSSSYTYSYQLGQGGYQLHQDDDWDYTYDDNGSMVERRSRVGIVTVPANTVEAMTYSHTGQMTSYTKTVDGTVEMTYELKYDVARNLRQTIVTTGVAPIAITITRNHTQDGGNILLVTDDTSLAHSRLFHLPDLDAPLSESALSSPVKWYLADQVYTIRAGVSGNDVSYNLFDSFGVSYIDLGSQAGFAGAFRIASDQIPLRARTYFPNVGRLAAEDPESPFGWEYADNSPLLLVDPTGEAAAPSYAKKSWRTTVYVLCRGGQVTYVGITYAHRTYVRGDEHRRKGKVFTGDPEGIVTYTDRYVARALEQYILGRLGADIHLQNKQTPMNARQYRAYYRIYKKAFQRVASQAKAACK